MDTPTAALSPAASAVADVVVTPLCVASTVTVPVVTSVSPARAARVAEVSLSTTEIAATGVSAMPPALPASASVVVV